MTAIDGRSEHQASTTNEDETRKIICCSTGVPRDDETQKVAQFARSQPRTRLPLRFGDWLVRRELISRLDLYAALQRLDSLLATARPGPCRLGDVLVELGLLDRDCVEQEARSFLAFTTFTVSLAPADPADPCTHEVGPFSCLGHALTAITQS